MVKVVKVSFTVCALIFVWLMSVETARACSCAVNEAVDKAFAQTPNVVILKARSIEKSAEGEKNYGYGGIKQTVLTVEKVFKGTLKVGQQMIFAQGGGADCIWTFDEESIGEEYLFYLGAKPIDRKSSENMIASTVRGTLSVAKDVWVAFTCSRSGMVKYRIGDLKYLENIAKARGKTRLSGVLEQSIRPATEDEEWKSNPLANFKVRISGNGKNIELQTDENGFYEIYDLPAGKYKITPEKINGFKFAEKDSTEIEIKPRSHTEQNFDYEINNRVSGKFFDANGKPLKGVCMDLIPARGKKSQYFYQGDCTEAGGVFSFDEIPAGDYLLVVNEEGKITAAEPFGAFYYPSATKREEASIITVGAGDFIDNLVVTAPNTAEVITVSGVLLFENGKPATKENAEYASIEFVLDGEKENSDDDEKVASRGDIDENGRFTIRILKGQKGRVFGALMTFPNDYENCPKLEKLIKQSKKRLTTIKTQTVEIGGGGDLTGIELKFPFPACKKSVVE